MGRVQCPNCEARLSCGCKLRKAKDGTQCCQSCIGSYEGQTTTQKKADNSSETAPSLVSISWLVDEPDKNGS